MAIAITNWLFCLAIIIQSWTIYQVNKRLLALQSRVFVLEMKQTYPDWKGIT